MLKGLQISLKAIIRLRKIKQTSEIVGIEEDMEGISDACMLNRETNYWQEVKQVLEESTVISWIRFPKLLLEKYFPIKKTQRIKQSSKFQSLSKRICQQLSTKLSLSNFQYLFRIKEIRTKESQTFSPGLKPWIQNKVVINEIASYAMLVHKDCIIESSCELFKKEKVDKKRKPPQNNQNGEKKPWNHSMKKPYGK